MRLLAKIIFGTVLFLLFENQNVSSQSSTEAWRIFMETDSIADESSFNPEKDKSEYLKLSGIYLKAAGIENKMPKPDSDFIGKCYLRAGNMLKQSHQFIEAVDYLKTASGYFKPTSGVMVDIAVSIASTYKLAFENKEFIAPVKEEDKITGKSYFTITNILSRNGKSMMVEISGGKMNGLFEDSEIIAFSSYNTDITRGNDYLGSGYVKELGDFTSIGEIILDDTSEIRNIVIEGDNVEVSAKMKTQENIDLLYEMSRYNIVFLDNYSDTLFFPWQILQNDDPGLREIIYNAMAFCVREMADFTTDFTDIYSSGAYVGLNCSQAMSVTEPCDIDEFLNFVKAYPARYLGCKWKISETHATWITHSSIKGNNYPEFVSWINEKKESGTLSEFVSIRPGYFTTPRIFEYFETFTNLYNSGLIDSSLQIADLLLDVSQGIGNDSITSVMHENRGNVFMNTGRSAEAIEEFSSSLKYNPDNFNSVYYRAYQYGQIGDYEKGIKDYITLTEKVPDYANGWGGLGWYLILQGRLFDAQTACHKAYELDSLNKSWIVNLGHISLFFGDTAKAYNYYSLYLDLLTTPNEINEGIMADFDIFLKNNWQTGNINRAKSRIQTQYDLKYRDHLLSNEMYNKGIIEKDSGNYRGLVDNMKQSLFHESNSDSARLRTIHIIYTWLGYGYQFLENYDSAFYYYNLGLQLAEKELKSEESIQNDLELLAWMFKTAGNTIKSNEYNVEYQAQVKKTEEKLKKKNLYFISVGIDNYNGFSYNNASSDASNMAESIKSLSKQGYDSVYVVLLKNEEAKRENIQKEFEKIISESNPYDLFIFYFAGFCGSEGDQNFLATSGFNSPETKGDELKNTISAYSFYTILSGIPARRQWLIFDAEAQKFVNSLLSIELNKSASVGEQEKSLFVICPSETRIERTEMGQGLLTSSIIEALQGKAENASTPDGVITAKEMESFVFQYMSQPSKYLNFSSYSSGRDFPLTYLSGYEKQSQSETSIAKPSMRGASLISDELSQESDANSEQTDYALIFATDNYDEWNDLNNPVFDGKALASLLEKEYGFKVEIVIDATRRIIQDKIITYKKKNYNPGDQLFIFFAGHGLYDEENMQEGYIVAKDSKRTDPYKDSYIPFSFLHDHTDGNCQHILLVLDVCFGGTFSSSITPMHRGNSDMYQQSSADELRSKLKGIKSRHYITSGNKEYVADGIPGKHSPFASFLIEGLMQGPINMSKYITYNSLVTFIDQIKTSTPTHSYYGKSEPGGNFIFEVKQEMGRGSLGDSKFSNSPKFEKNP